MSNIPRRPLGPREAGDATEDVNGENQNTFGDPETPTPVARSQTIQSSTGGPGHRRATNTSMSELRAERQNNALTPPGTAIRAENQQVPRPRATIADRLDSRRERRLSEAQQYSTSPLTPRKRNRPEQTGAVERKSDGQYQLKGQPRAGSHGYMGPEHEQLSLPDRLQGEVGGSILHSEKTVAARVKIWFFRFLALRHDETMEFARSWDNSTAFETLYFRTYAYQHASNLNHSMFGTAKFSAFVGEKVQEHERSRPGGAPEYDTLTIVEQRNYWMSLNRKDDYVLQMFQPLSSSVDIEAAYRDPVWGKYMTAVFAAACIYTWKHRSKWEAEFTLGSTMKENINRKQIYEEIRHIAQLEILGLPTMSEVPVVDGGPGTQRRRDLYTATVGEEFGDF